MDVRSYGISRLALVPVRKESNDRSEQTTQLLFGDHYEIIESSIDKNWLFIKIFFDGYEGWIDAKQHHAIIPDYFEQINHANFKITTDISSGILYKKNPLTILIGSIVPISNSELFKMEEQFAFNGEAKSLGQKREFEFLSTIAMKYLHAPYQWGGKSPFGIDCSGFTQMVYKICGFPVSRDAHQQATGGRAVAGIDNSLPGDLAFFYNKSGNIGHVGIVLQDHKIIHASGRVRIDQLMEEGIVDVESKVITHSLAGIRRIITSQ
ncbi:MAG: C40 family peptidase [Cyclobacteriaceae bacterium]